MSVHYVIGDATDPQGSGVKIIAHVCNDVGAWGAGFVMSLSRRWSAPERKYRAWRADGEGFALGRVEFVRVVDDTWVCNMIAQHGIGGSAPPIRYDALLKCLAQVAREAKRQRAFVHMPRIGCGLAGGNWDEVGPIVDRALEGIEVFVYDLPARPK